MSDTAVTTIEAALATAERWRQQFPEGGTTTNALAVLAAEVGRLRRGWLRVIQGENSCVTSGKPCTAKRCGCDAEMEMLANE